MPAIKTSRKLLELILYSKFKCEALYVCLLTTERTPTLNIEWGQINPKATQGLSAVCISFLSSTNRIVLPGTYFKTVHFHFIKLSRNGYPGTVHQHINRPQLLLSLRNRRKKATSVGQH